MSPAGLEPATYGLKVPERDDATNYSLRGSDPKCEGAHYNSELQRLIDVWPTFSAAKRAALLAVADAPIE
jgi:hypothetical protein